MLWVHWYRQCGTKNSNKLILYQIICGLIKKSSFRSLFQLLLLLLLLLLLQLAMLLLLFRPLLLLHHRPLPEVKMHRAYYHKSVFRNVIRFSISLINSSNAGNGIMQIGRCVTASVCQYRLNSYTAESLCLYTCILRPLSSFFWIRWYCQTEPQIVIHQLFWT